MLAENNYRRACNRQMFLDSNEENNIKNRNFTKQTTFSNVIVISYN